MKRKKKKENYSTLTIHFRAGCKPNKKNQDRIYIFVSLTIFNGSNLEAFLVIKNVKSNHSFLLYLQHDNTVSQSKLWRKCNQHLRCTPTQSEVSTVEDVKWRTATSFISAWLIATYK